MLHHVDVELVGVPVAVAALGALVLGRVHLVLVVQQTLCFSGSQSVGQILFHSWKYVCAKLVYRGTGDTFGNPQKVYSCQFHLTDLDPASIPGL